MEDQSANASLNKPSRPLEWIVWGGLACVIVGIFGVFIFVKFVRPQASVAAPLPVYGTVSGFALTNQLGRVAKSGDLKGRIWIADVIFTRCPGPCARMTKTMSELQAALPADNGVQLVSLTADPAFDTPDVLSKYAARFGAQQERWQFLTGDKKVIYDLAIDGLKLSVGEITPEERKSVDDLFIHSTRFALVDTQGRVRGFFDGEAAEAVAKIVAAIEALSKEQGL